MCGRFSTRQFLNLQCFQPLGLPSLTLLLLSAALHSPPRAVVPNLYLDPASSLALPLLFFSLLLPSVCVRGGGVKKKKKESCLAETCSSSRLRRRCCCFVVRALSLAGCGRRPPSRPPRVRSAHVFSEYSNGAASLRLSDLHQSGLTSGC